MTPTHQPIPSDRFDLVARVTLAPEQIRFAGTVSEAFGTPDPKVDFHGLFLGGAAVGFYKIDRAFERSLTDTPGPLLGLRAFMVDQHWQGLGLASAAVRGFGDYLRPQYPGYDALWLTVNLQNPAAIRVYLRGGFQDTGRLYTEGPAGPQHILRLPFSLPAP